MSPSRTISSALLASLFSGAVFHRVNLESLIQEFQLEDIFKSLATDSLVHDARIDIDVLGPLLRALWHEMDDEASGFLGRPLKTGMFSMMCHSIITAGNLRRALLRSARFLELLNEDLSIELIENGDDAQLCVNYTNPHQLESVFFVTSIFVIWIRLSCWLIQRSILLERIEFKFPEPAYSDEFDYMFPCRHKFCGQSNRVIFNKKFLSLPITQDSESLARFLHQAPSSLLTQYRADESTSAHVKRLLINRHGMSVSLENKSFQDVADALNTTTHTIRRRLKEEGNSFQEIKDSIRREQASALLENTALSVVIISGKLGFSEPAAFARAFKKWTGMTPGNYRNTL